MHASLDKTNTGELSLAGIKHYIAQAEVDEGSPQGVLPDPDLPRWFVYTILFAAAVVILAVGSYVVWGHVSG